MDIFGTHIENKRRYFSRYKNASWAVAGFPTSGTALENETADQAMVKQGFDRYKGAN